MKQKITPFLWFDHEAEEAARFYVAIFNGGPAAAGQRSKVGAVSRYDEAGAKASGRPVGSAMTVAFDLEGQEFTAINGGPHFTFSGAISFVIGCGTQEEVDYFWEKLSEGGESGVCGWINRDRFGVTWQVVPTMLPALLGDPDPAKAARVMQAMLGMKKIVIAELEQAREGK